MNKNGQFDISKDAFIRNEKAFQMLLSEREFEMLRLRTLEDMTFVSIARLYGLSTSRIRQICARSVDRIKQARYSIR